MYRISEQVRFCYGHRLMDYVGKCARIHGHNGVVEIVASGKSLDHQGFVVDFGVLEEAVKAYLDERFDHRLLLRQDDPVIPALKAAGEPYVALDVNPTAENLARLIYEHLRQKGLPVSEIRFHETETSVACYSPD